MGRKKQNKSDVSKDGKDTSQQQTPGSSTTSQQRPLQGEAQESVQQGGRGGQQQRDSQQGGRGGQQQRPQQRDGGGQQQNAQQGGRGGQQQGPHQSGGGGQQQREPQQGGRGGQQQRPHQSGSGGQQQLPQPGSSGGQQQGGRGGQQQGGRGGQQQREPHQSGGGGQQQRDSQQGGRGGQQQWPQQGGGGRQQQREPQQNVQQQQRPHQSGGGGQQQRDSQQSVPQGGRGGQQQRPQHGGGGGQQQREPQQYVQQGGRGGQQGYQQGGGGGQQQGGRGQQQQRSQQSGGGGPQQAGRGAQQGAQQQHISNEVPLPAKGTSCNGIVRGTLGDPGTVEVNYLRLNVDRMPDEAYHYDIAITPDRPKKFLRPAFEQFISQAFPNAIVAFDGMKNCYSAERLKVPVELTIEVPDSSDRKKEFMVRIQETDDCVVDLSSLRSYQTDRVFDKPMRALQVLEVVLASNNHARGIRVGRSFFRRPLDAFYLEDGYEAWTGLYQAAILGEMPLLNVDIAHKSFPCESTLIQYLDNIRADKNGDLRNNNYVFRDITQYFNGINIIYTPPANFGAPPKQYKVMGIGEPASKKKFKTDDGKELTVENYFRSKGYNLRYPHLNCITVGSTIRQISLPMELCSIPAGQALNKKDQSRQVEKMIRYAATSTNVRKKKIMDLLSYFDHNVNPTIRHFGLSLGSSFLKVPIRLLPSPSLEYLQGRTVRTFKGAWRMDDNKFLICSNPPNGHRWAILYEESRGGRGISYHDLEEFKTLVIRTSQGLTMNLQNSAEIMSYRVQQLQGMLKDFARNKFDLVFVVLSERGTPYAKVKQIAELEVGILTQCIKDKTVFRTKKDRTVFSNILLKVNGKLNGTNHKIGQDRNSNLLSPIKNVMYLGADVTHPSPDQRHIPSVVGVAASHDPNGACYNCQYRLQRSTVENIEDMESIATRHLEVYFQYQKKYPDQILYYRDGVSDGQFPIVEREEISAIKRACAKKRFNPKLTCIIVVKRHHTRFFPMSNPVNDRDFNNVQAGTVVDQYITHPNEVQFFMVSHQSIQGTAKPTRYNVIMDESKLDINLLQKLTYNLCHLFPRCNRAVSYPAPAYLAHLVAFRGRVYLEGTQRFDKNLKNEYDRRRINPEFMNKNPMYFI